MPARRRQNRQMAARRVRRPRLQRLTRRHRARMLRRWSRSRRAARASRALCLIPLRLHWRRASSCRRRNPRHRRLCRRPCRRNPQRLPSRSQRRPCRPRHLFRRRRGRALSRQCSRLPRKLRPFQSSNLPRSNPRSSKHRPQQKPRRRPRLRLLPPRKRLRHRNLSHRNQPHSKPRQLPSPLRPRNWWRRNLRRPPRHLCSHPLRQ